MSVSTGLACSCVSWEGMGTEKAYKYLEELAAIFDGEVISLGEEKTLTEELTDGQKSERIVRPVRFKVLRTWKALDGNEITLNTQAGGSSCSFIPTVGAKYRIYTRTGFIGYCSVGQFPESTLRLKYGQGTVIEPPNPPPTTEGNESFLSSIWNRIASWFS